MLQAVRYTMLFRPRNTNTTSDDLRAAEQMLLAALTRISDLEDKRDKKGVWAK